jgi:methionine-rich copper-binding protein CopC
LSEPILRKQKFLAVFCLSWAVALSATAHAGVFPQHAPVLGVAPTANSNGKTAPTSAAVLIGEPGLGGPNDFLRVFDSIAVNHGGSITTSPVGDSTKLTVPLTAMKSGWYAAHWNVQSEDGHMAGGDDGLWWAFGVKATTPKSTQRKIILSASVPVVPLPSQVKSTISGSRVGTRTITIAIAKATVTTIRWERTDAEPSPLHGAIFSWPVTYVKKTKLYTSTGIIPFAGTYTLTAQINSVRNGATYTALWSNQVHIS